MRLSCIAIGVLLEGEVSSIIDATKPIRLKSLELPASLLGMSTLELYNIIDSRIIRYDLREYIPNSFWDQIGVNSSEKLRACYEKAKQIRPGKLRYMQGYEDSYNKAFEAMKTEPRVNIAFLNQSRNNCINNIYFLDTFFHLVSTYRPTY